jgi:alpha-D-xyloside xylohydrolase
MRSRFGVTSKVAVVGVAATLAGACSSTPSSTPVAVRTVSLGSGVTATLGADGSFTIMQQGKALLATASGEPLLTRDVDANNPVGFHDPKNLVNDTFTEVTDSAIEIDSPAPGVVHLATTADAMPTVLVSLALASDEGFYTGLGERYDHTDARGQIVGMQLEIDGNFESGTTDRHVPVPWIVSSRGYGVFVKSREAGAWDVASTDMSLVRATFEGTAMDVTFVVDPDPLAVIATLTKMTGLARATPTWALAPMMWRHVDTQAEALGDLQMIRSLHVPTTTFWIDDGWQVALDTLDFDTTKFPDAALFAQQAQSLGFELFGWNSPYLQDPSTSGTQNEAQQVYATAAAANDFVESADGTPFSAPGPDSSEGFGLVDFTSTAARAFWAGRASSAVAIGLNGFKLDYAEDMVPDILGGRLNLKLADGESERTARSYPLGYHGAYRDALARTSDGGVLVVRASTYGGAQVADIVWPGDLDNGFQHRGDIGPSGTQLVGGLPASIVAAQTLSASGFPLFGADTGGYRGGAPTKEALIRWAEHTALTMVLQLGPGENKYPWNYDAETVTLYTALANLHQSLVPYLSSLLVDAQTNGTPTIRPLPLAYPTDTDAPAAADDEYMLGPDLLVAPVVTEGATSRQVHLPPGNWVGWWDDALHAGASSIAVQSPLGQPPLFVRAGALLPLYPGGFDTMIASTDASTVSLSAMAGFDVARSWVSGNATASFPDGSTVTVNDDANDVEVIWTPMGTGNALTITVDLTAHGGQPGSISSVVVASGSALTNLGSTGNVGTATTGAYVLDGDTAVLRLFGASDVHIQ